MPRPLNDKEVEVVSRDPELERLYRLGVLFVADPGETVPEGYAALAYYCDNCRRIVEFKSSDGDKLARILCDVKDMLVIIDPVIFGPFKVELKVLGKYLGGNNIRVFVVDIRRFTEKLKSGR